MSKLNCESISMAAMALAEGYQSDLSAQQIQTHLASCSECRRELGQLEALSRVLDAQARRQRTEDIWPLIETRIERRFANAAPVQSSSPAWAAFVILGLLLLGYRIVELVPDRNFSLLFKVVPLLFVIAAFSYLRENPFKIAAELNLEGE